MTSPLSRFVFATLAWLPVAFVVWYFAAPVLMAPVALLAAGAAHGGFGEIVSSVDLRSAVVTFTTTLRPGQTGAGAIVTVDVNALLYTFGMPMFAALVLASGEQARVRKLLIGYSAMVPFAAFGVLSDFLKNIGITSGPLVASQAGFGPVEREAIAFAFQFGSLILPTVVPAALWVLLHRPFLDRLREAAPAR